MLDHEQHVKQPTPAGLYRMWHFGAGTSENRLHHYNKQQLFTANIWWTTHDFRETM